MDLQVISRDGEPEYAVLPWKQYQALLQAAGLSEADPPTEELRPQPDNGALPSLTQLPELRRAKGVEAVELARAVGISPSYLDLIEQGDRQPDAAIRRSLAWQVGVPGWQEVP